MKVKFLEEWPRRRKTMDQWEAYAYCPWGRYQASFPRGQPGQRLHSQPFTVLPLFMFSRFLKVIHPAEN